MPDEDIMDQLKEIDDDEILGEEVNLDDDLDFEGLDEMDGSPAPAPAVAPPAPRPEARANPGEAKPDTKNKAAAKKPPDAKPAKPKAAGRPAAQPPPAAEASVTEVEEVVVRAKTLRIVADKVVIEPGDNISFS